MRQTLEADRFAQKLAALTTERNELENRIEALKGRVWAILVTMKELGVKHPEAQRAAVVFQVGESDSASWRLKPSDAVLRILRENPNGLEIRELVMTAPRHFVTRSLTPHRIVYAAVQNLEDKGQVERVGRNRLRAVFTDEGKRRNGRELST